MLRALYEYGLEHRDELPRDGYAERAVHAIGCFGANGKFLGARTPERRKMMAPNIPGLTSGPVANVLMEKAETAIRLESGRAGNSLAKLDAKRECFLDYFRDGADDVPAFQVVLDALSDATVLEKIQDAVLDMKCGPSSVVAFSVDGVMLADMPETEAWWRDYRHRNQEASGVKALDIITGEECEPVRLFKQLPVSAAGGGQSSGVSLISFNEEAFCSYGAKQGMNAPMSEETASLVMDALTYLGDRGHNLGDMRVVHWYAFDAPASGGTMPEVPDVIQELLSGVSLPEPERKPGKAKAAAKNAQADRLLGSVFDGRLPAGVEDGVYHIIVTKPGAARTSVRHYGVGSYKELYDSVERWFDDMRLVRMDGTGTTRNYGLDYLVGSVSPETSGKNRTAAVSGLYQPMLMASIGAGDVPRSAVQAAFGRIRSMSHDGFSEPNRTVPFQILKLWLNRRRNITEEETLMEELNPGIPSVGYQCGRLLAVYEDLQRLATNRSDLTSRYYAGCSQRPAFVIGRLQQLASYYMAKLESGWWRGRFQELFSEIYGRIDVEIPKVLSVEDQAYFALGYWQQVAAIRKNQAERKAEKEKSKATAGTNDKEDK